MLINLKSFLILPLIFFFFSGFAQAADDGLKPAPLPKKWGFHNESQVGLLVSEGNSQGSSTNIEQKNNYDWEHNNISALYNYLRAKSGAVESARRWSAGLRYDRDLSNRWALFTGELVESDPFSGFNYRYNTDVGAKYMIFKRETWSWGSEAGYRYSHEERRIASAIDQNFARLYMEINANWTDKTSTKLWVEYLPELNSIREDRINSEASVSSLMTSILAVKLAYLIKYDSQPPPGTLHDTDTLFTTSLVAKF